ncbi:MAG: hypothetical protein MRY59_04630 [Aquisalinus sp.]|nr:hypothetical protein [Aquisalinus sp.]
MSKSPTDNQENVKLMAEFWRSPFAVAAAVVLTAQVMMMLYGALTGRDMNFVMTMPMLLIAAMMLVTGVWPGWNYIRLGPDGFEQHAGLTSNTTGWGKVQNIRIFSNWVEIRHVDGNEPGQKKVRTIRLLNRYGLPAHEFGDLVERYWRAGRYHEV